MNTSCAAASLHAARAVPDTAPLAKMADELDLREPAIDRQFNAGDIACRG